MADNTTLPGAGDVIAADEVAGVKYQRVKVTTGADGVAGADVGGRNVDGGSTERAMFVDNRPNVVPVSVTSTGLTIAATAYTAGDQMGAIMEFASAARAAGGTGVITGAVLLDEGDVLGAVDLVLFRETVTLAANNDPFAVSDADMRKSVGLVSMPAAVDLGANRLSALAGVAVAYDCTATSLFVALITRSANAVFTAVGDIKLLLYLARD